MSNMGISDCPLGKSLVFPEKIEHLRKRFRVPILEGGGFIADPAQCVTVVVSRALQRLTHLGTDRAEDGLGIKWHLG